MIIIIGLGNPGKKYIRTRHNLGFRVIDGFKKKEKFPKFRFSKKFNSLISEGRLNKKKIILAKPHNFMNESGKAVKPLATFYKTTRTVLVVVHDDVDLPLGKLRISKGRGAAGHKGVQSIIDELKTKNFVRFRIGIRPTHLLDVRRPTIKPFSHRTIEDFVLQKFTKKEEKILKEVIKRTCQAIETAITEGIEKAQSTEHHKFYLRALE